jgi:type III secretion protein T
MEGLFTTDHWSSMALLLGLSTTRVAVAFLLLPLFTSDLVPALVRNAIFLAVAALSVAMQPAVDVSLLRTVDWMRLFAKEAFLGGAIGLLFGSVLWAFEIAGQVIDMKTGASMAQVVDPLSGHQTPLTGAFLSRLASFVFMFSGGFLLLVGVLLQSYALWPVASWLPPLKAGGVVLFESELGRLMTLGMLISAPALVVLYLIDGVLGLVNRYAQQLNVFSLSASLKVLAANVLLLMTLGSFVQLIVDDISARPAVVLRTLKALFGGG